jgi:signal transduction histidine kinase
VVGDEARLTRVVANLADNAERHASGRVEFAVARHQDGVLLSITDDGPGVPVAEREHIFERFVRLDSARAHQEAGAGLGLSIVAEIVRAHGGKVWVEDAGPGARFVLQLPLVDSAEPAPSTAGPDRRWAASAPARTR